LGIRKTIFQGLIISAGVSFWVAYGLPLSHLFGFESVLSTGIVVFAILGASKVLTWGMDKVE